MFFGCKRSQSASAAARPRAFASSIHCWSWLGWSGFRGSAESRGLTTPFCRGIRVRNAIAPDIPKWLIFTTEESNFGQSIGPLGLNDHCSDRIAPVHLGLEHHRMVDGDRPVRDQDAERHRSLGPHHAVDLDIVDDKLVAEAEHDRLVELLTSEELHHAVGSSDCDRVKHRANASIATLPSFAASASSSGMPEEIDAIT